MNGNGRPLPGAPQEWSYEMRREMQEIVPGLWLGPFAMAKKKDLLQDAGITHIICIRDASEAHIVRPFFPNEFVYKEFEVSESSPLNLIPKFSEARQFIDEGLLNGGKVFVHCNAGICRSPAFVIAYVMEKQNCDFQSAFQYVQDKRFCLNPTEPFRYQLKEYEPIFAAREAMMRGQMEMGTKGEKRKQEDDEEDETMDTRT